MNASRVGGYERVRKQVGVLGRHFEESKNRFHTAQQLANGNERIGLDDRIKHIGQRVREVVTRASGNAKPSNYPNSFCMRPWRPSERSLLHLPLYCRGQ